MSVLNGYKEVSIPMEGIELKGNLRISEKTKGIIIFSHGSGSSRMSSRNNYVADVLLEAGFSSLLFDLLTEEEDTVYENRFDIELLTERLVWVAKWIKKYPETRYMPIGLFGASTGAASALCAAAKLPKDIKAVVSRGGRPDLALPVLASVKAPTLLLVGSRDDIVIQLNRKAMSAMGGLCELQIIEGATHLFSEPGKLKEVALQTIGWFEAYLTD